MNFVNFESRERHRFIESAQAQLVEGLEAPEIQKDLGHYAVELYEAARNVYIPNCRGSRIKIPKGLIHTNFIPVVVLERHETKTAPPEVCGLSPAQMEALAGRLANSYYKSAESFTFYRDIEDINTALRGRGPMPIGLPYQNGVMTSMGVRAEFKKSFYPGLSDHDLMIQGRPLIGLWRRVNEVNRGSSEVALLHELQHAIQFSQNPTLPTKEDAFIEDGWRKELEARHVSAKYGAIRYEQTGSLNTGLLSDTVTEKIRSALETEGDKFNPNDNIITALGPIIGQSFHMVDIQKETAPVSMTGAV